MFNVLPETSLSSQARDIELCDLLNFLYLISHSSLLRKHQALNKFEHTTTQPGYFVWAKKFLVEVCVSLTISISKHFFLQGNETDYKESEWNAAIKCGKWWNCLHVSVSICSFWFSSISINPNRMNKTNKAWESFDEKSSHQYLPKVAPTLKWQHQGPEGITTNEAIAEKQAILSNKCLLWWFQCWNTKITKVDRKRHKNADDAAGSILP